MIKDKEKIKLKWQGKKKDRERKDKERKRQKRVMKQIVKQRVRIIISKKKKDEIEKYRDHKYPPLFLIFHYFSNTIPCGGL